MYTLVNDRQLIRNIIGNTAAAIFCAFFGAVYERYSHEVYSYYMIYAFAIPLIMGAFLLALMLYKKIKIDAKALRYWNAGIATLTIGVIFMGVLEIYGTTNKRIWFYPIVGIPLIIAGIIRFFRAAKSEELK